jgi:hypothetical protein
MKWARALVCLLGCVCLLAVGGFAPARAQEAPPAPAMAPPQKVGDAFFDQNRQEEGVDAFALFTDAGPPKFVALLAEVYVGVGKPADQLLIIFDNAMEWAKFVALWNKAIQKPPPTQEEAYKINTDTDDSYFDAGSQVLVSVSKETDGGIEFSFAGKPDANKNPSAVGLVSVSADQFKAFEQDMAILSAFFDAQ